ncbi:metal-binding protein [Deinococcus ruber]|uniref:Hydrolase n=1 Tax=Deinococcus ruber TaxID=1848197 RepID=A0A918CKR6_9DEIO|nr:metal-binding protein [Deinococcus ruber]GGR28008.1 hydrolase [Deinococcus ruber]
MPSGRVHNLINIAVFAGLSVAALYLSGTQRVVITPLQATSFSAAFASGTFLLSPDLDLATGNVDSKRRWGPLGFLWVPYGLMFSHRGLSHTWLLGPLTRLAYVALIVALAWGLLYGAGQLFPALKVPLPHLPPLSLSVLGAKFVYPALAGYYLSQWLHLIADGVRPDHGMRLSGKKFRRATRRFR